MFDFLGFGLSATPPQQVYSLLTQAAIVAAVAARFAAERVMLVAHDMGSSMRALAAAVGPAGSTRRGRARRR